MKRKKGSRIECCDTTIIIIITKSDSIGLSKLSRQIKKGKTTKNARRWTENELELFAEVLADS